MSVRISTLGAVTLASLLLAQMPAHSADTSPQQAGAQQQGSGLQEVTVTATRTGATSAQSTPLALSSGRGDATAFVLVHGAWAGGWCYGRVARLLRQRGFPAFTPTLTGSRQSRHWRLQPQGLSCGGSTSWSPERCWRGHSRAPARYSKPRSAGFRGKSPAGVQGHVAGAAGCHPLRFVNDHFQTMRITTPKHCERHGYRCKRHG